MNFCFWLELICILNFAFAIEVAILTCLSFLFKEKKKENKVALAWATVRKIIPVLIRISTEKVKMKQKKRMIWNGVGRYGDWIAKKCRIGTGSGQERVVALCRKNYDWTNGIVHHGAGFSSWKVWWTDQEVLKYFTYLTGQRAGVRNVCI